jgi:hypothetical protein
LAPLRGARGFEFFSASERVSVSTGALVAAVDAANGEVSI